jgi:hypothetical protein
MTGGRQSSKINGLRFGTVDPTPDQDWLRLNGSGIYVPFSSQRLDSLVDFPTPGTPQTPQIDTSGNLIFINSAHQIRESIVSDIAPVSPLVGQQWHESSGNKSALVQPFPWTWTGSRWASPRFTRDLNQPGATYTVPARASGAAARSNFAILSLASFSPVRGGTAYDVFVEDFFGQVFTGFANSATRFLIFQMTTRNNTNAVSNIGSSANSQSWTTASRWNPVNIALDGVLTSSTTNPIIFATNVNITEPLESAAVASWTFVLSLCLSYQLLRK